MRAVYQALLPRKARFVKAQNYYNKLKLSTSLGKPNLSVFVSGSAVTGFLLSSNDLDLSLASIFTGTLLCSLSANSFNQLYEYKTDKLMNRTKLRPLPSGKLSLYEGLTFGLTTGTLGPLLLYQGCGATTATLGVLNILLYAGVYTPLKQKTVLNTWVGSIVGAIPPLMGYCVNNDFSSLLSIEAMVLPSLLFLWQFPHFFALSFLYKDDYKRGGHKMISDISYDPVGLKTAKHILNYSILLSIIPFIGYINGSYSIMLPLEGVLINSYNIYLAKQFLNERTKSNARKIFLTSLWYLPLLMGLMVVHKKQHNGDSHMLEKLRQLGKDLCIHEVFTEDGRSPEQKAFCASQR